MGQEICMRVDGRSFTARCEMSFNSPMWRETGAACVFSQRGGPESVGPGFDAGLDHA